MLIPRRGEVWVADLGLAAKVRPVISVAYGDRDYALMAIVPHTTSPRGAAFEVSAVVRGLEAGVFNVQGLLAVPVTKLLRKVSELTDEQMAAIELAVRRWLGFS